YDVIRAERLARLKQLGLFAHDFLPAPPADVPSKRWAHLSDTEREVEARKMEIYAAMVEHLDMNIGRLIAYLKQIGEYDNTLIVFMSDNGAAGEDHAKGYSPSDAHTDNALANLGRKGSNVSYGYRWAEVSSTPMSLVKGTSAEGGIAVPAIIHLPARLAAAQGSILHGYGRVDDLVPTFLAVANLSSGDTPAGKLPFSGQSLLPMLTGQSPGRTPQVASELFGQPYVRDGDWKLVSAHAPDDAPPNPNQPYRWRLFNLAKDRGETHDLAAEQLERVATMKAAWRRYAEWAGVVEPPAQP
ncbi:MAG: sulfatase-like hydrolase/transferase, partial [Pseudomonas fluorescens]